MSNLQDAFIKLMTEDIDGQLSIDEKGLPELERPYNMRERDDNRLQITSSHPYDMTDYCWAISENMDPNGSWQIIDDGKKVDAFIGWSKTLDRMKEIDSTKERRIDRT